MNASIPESKTWQLSAILLCAFSLRLGAPGSLGIDHFDEGVYAAAGEAMFSNLPEFSIDPGIVPYGPPLTVFGIAFSNLLFGGPSDLAAILPGILAGTLAVYLAFRLTRSIAGQQPAHAVATMVAVSGLTIAFSRSAMTEPIFVLTWLLAMLAGAMFLGRPGFGTAVPLGLAVGLAQLAKYNGALTGVIVALTALLDVLVVPRETPPDFRLLRRRIIWGMFAAGLAAAVYAPWFLFVEEHGGYRALMRHHGSYVNGSGRWLSNLRLQLAQGWVFQAQPISIAVGAIFLIILGRSAGMGNSPWRVSKLIALVVLPNAPVYAAACSIRRTWAKGEVALRMVVVWWVAMFLITPFYHPYARLWLPAYLASLVLSVNWVFDCGHPSRLRQVGRWSFKKSWMEYSVVILAFAGLSAWSVDFRALWRPGGLPTVWSDRTSLRDEISAQADKIRQATGRGQTVFLLLNPAGRRALALELGNRQTGPGRLAVVENLSSWQGRNGPILIDLSLIGPEEIRTMTGVPRETLEKAVSSGQRPRSRRGLITLLDMTPGVALGEKTPATGLVWVDP